MDSNVSKNTFSHKFFKLRFAGRNELISIKDLLKQNILSAIDLYQQKEKISLEKTLRAIINRDRIVVLASWSLNNQVLLALSGSPIVYSSSLALFLTSQTQQSPQIMAEELAALLRILSEQLNDESDFKVPITVAKSGWINFYLTSVIIASWLERSLKGLKKKISHQVISTKLTTLPNTPQNLFAIQYVHARCCSLLRLAAKEQLISLESNLNNRNELLLPQTISWLDPLQQLGFQTPAAWNLLHQLFLVSDVYCSVSQTDWLKTARHLSEAVAVFWQECPLMQKTAQTSSTKSIACVGLIALAQGWLQIILTEKLNVIAPRNL